MKKIGGRKKLSEKEFIRLLGKDIKVSFLDCDILEGRVHTFSWGADTEDGIATIDLKTSNGYIQVKHNDFEKIEVKN